MEVKDLQVYIERFCTILNWKEEFIGPSTIWWSYTFMRMTTIRTMMIGLSILGITVHTYHSSSFDRPRGANCEINVYILRGAYEVDIYLGTNSSFWKDYNF